MKNLLAGILSLLSLLSLSQNSSYQFSSRIDDNTIAKTAGYLRSQQLVCTAIKNNYPNYRSSIISLESEFNLLYGKGVDGVKEEIIRKLGNDNYNKFITSMDDQLKDILPEITNEYIQKYIEELQNRNQGVIASPILETLLTYQYKDNPDNEFSDGFYYDFISKDNEKAKGLNFKLSIPYSWNSEEADRPNIVQKFISQGGFGQSTIMVLVKDLDGYVPSMEEKREIFLEEKLNELVDEPYKFISGKTIVIDNQPGALIKIMATSKRLDMEFTLMALQFATIYDSKMLIVQCLIYDDDPKYLEDKLVYYNPLFMLVANSIVLLDQY